MSVKNNVSFEGSMGGGLDSDPDSNDERK